METKWIVGIGAGVAALLGVLWYTLSPAKAAEKGIIAAKNKAKNAAAGVAYVAGKTAGFTRGGIEAAAGKPEDISIAEDADVVAASKKTDDPAGFIKGFAEGYTAGFAAATTAKATGETYSVSLDEVPPPPPTAGAPPSGKPASYTTIPNGDGYNTAYGQALTYGKNNKLDYAPGGGNALGLKSADAATATTKYDSFQMLTWAAAWDKGFQDGWDLGQAKYHTGSTSGPTTKYGTPSEEEGGGGTTEVTPSSDTSDAVKEIEGGTWFTGLPKQSVSLLTVGGSLLAVGWEPTSRTILRVAGARVLGIRGAYSPPIMSIESPDYGNGFSSGCAAASKAAVAILESEAAGMPVSAVATPPLGTSKRYYDGYMAGWTRCLASAIKAGRAAMHAAPGTSTPASQVTLIERPAERHGRQPPPPPDAIHLRLPEVTMSDALLYVGHDPSTGAVISVAGVTVLGIRGAYSPPILAARRKFGTSGDFEHALAKGYSETGKWIAEKRDSSGVLTHSIKQWVSGGKWWTTLLGFKPSVDLYKQTSDFRSGYWAGVTKRMRDSVGYDFPSDQFVLDESVKSGSSEDAGRHDGAVFCEKKWATWGSMSREEIISYMHLRPSDAGEVSRFLAGESEEYKRGFYAGKEACEKAYNAWLHGGPRPSKVAPLSTPSPAPISAPQPRTPRPEDVTHVPMGSQQPSSPTGMPVLTWHFIG